MTPPSTVQIVHYINSSPVFIHNRRNRSRRPAFGGQEKIHRGGNAEQYHADKKYKEAVADAVEACADDTKGQTCYLCALGWACWKTYLGRPEEDYPRRAALNLLAGGLYSVKNFKEAASVHETQLSLSRRLGASKQNILMMQSNLSNLYEVLGRREEALQMLREVYNAWLKLNGPRDRATLKSACDLAGHMISNSLLDEAKQFLSEQIPLALKVLGPDDMETLKMRWRYALALGDPKDYDETVAILEDVARRSRRVFGDLNPMTTSAGDDSVNDSVNTRSINDRISAVQTR